MRLELKSHTEKGFTLKPKAEIKLFGSTGKTTVGL